MEPALTPEEWAAGGFNRDLRGVEETVTLHEIDGTPFEAACYGQQASRSEQTVSISDSVWGPRALSALAALALYGTPNGFTHEDVAFLEDEIDVIGSDSIVTREDEASLAADRARLRSIIDRIAALLPPER